MKLRHIAKILSMLALIYIVPTFAYAADEPAKGDKIQIGIVGDVMAQGVAQALIRQLKRAQPNNLVPKNFAKGSSGFVRNDYYNWNAALPRILKANKLDYMLVFMGSNDRQSIRIKGRSYKAKTPKWREEYVHRISEFLGTLKSNGVKVIWLGQPISRGKRFSNDMALFNEIYRQHVESQDGVFFDVWNLFANENGKYSRRGADMAGQIKTLRASNGIHFNRNGYDKIAFQVIELVQKLESGYTGFEGIDEGELVEAEKYDLSENTGDDTIVIARNTQNEPIQEPKQALGQNVFSNDNVDEAETDNEPEIRPLVEFDPNLPLWKNVLEKGFIIDSEFGRSDDFAWPRN